jgi:hypothetical protein
VLNGFNGTYFVYGQTGTGKTYTMGVLKSIEFGAQGIIPNTLEYLFNQLKDHKNNSKFTVHLSFYHIYLE